MMWSCTEMPIGLAISTIDCVISMSARLGVGSPEGWLWTNSTLAEAAWMGSVQASDVLEPLRSADVRFAQVERVYSERGAYQQQALVQHSRQHPRMAMAFNSVPFGLSFTGQSS